MSFFTRGRVSSIFAALLTTALIVPANAQAQETAAKKKEDHIVYIYGPVNDEMAKTVITQLRKISKESPTDEIEMQINSIGGEVNAGLAIYNAMNSIPNPIKTLCIGKAFSMAGYLLATGTQGRREALADCEIMLHEPSMRTKVTATDAPALAENIKRTAQRFEQIFSDHTGWTPEQTIELIRGNDLNLSADDAKTMRIIDTVIPNLKPVVATQKPALPNGFCKSEERKNLGACRSSALGTLSLKGN
jgi:ATP-dependent Clp protease protease subunit